ncbi:hypothetical protein, partial [Streptomyces sp. NPDC056632]|uniref:hypothetical protein n=1 Tax=Streptomyces sp. NPDC056632 TaxID=3345884 RepID=UPI00368CE9F6
FGLTIADKGEGLEARNPLEYWTIAAVAQKLTATATADRSLTPATELAEKIRKELDLPKPKGLRGGMRQDDGIPPRDGETSEQGARSARDTRGLSTPLTPEDTGLVPDTPPARITAVRNQLRGGAHRMEEAARDWALEFQRLFGGVDPSWLLPRLFGANDHLNHARLGIVRQWISGLDIRLYTPEEGQDALAGVIASAEESDLEDSDSDSDTDSVLTLPPRGEDEDGGATQRRGWDALTASASGDRTSGQGLLSSAEELLFFSGTDGPGSSTLDAVARQLWPDRGDAGARDVHDLLYRGSDLYRRAFDTMRDVFRETGEDAWLTVERVTSDLLGGPLVLEWLDLIDPQDTGGVWLWGAGRQETTAGQAYADQAIALALDQLRRGVQPDAEQIFTALRPPNQGSLADQEAELWGILEVVGVAGIRSENGDQPYDLPAVLRHARRVRRAEPDITDQELADRVSRAVNVSLPRTRGVLLGAGLIDGPVPANATRAGLRARAQAMRHEHGGTYWTLTEIAQELYATRTVTEWQRHLTAHLSDPTQDVPGITGDPIDVEASSDVVEPSRGKHQERDFDSDRDTVDAKRQKTSRTDADEVDQTVFGQAVYEQAVTLASDGNREWPNMTRGERAALTRQVALTLRERGEDAARHVVTQLRMEHEVSLDGIQRRALAEQEAQRLIALHHVGWHGLPPQRRRLELAEIAHAVIHQSPVAAERTALRLARDNEPSTLQAERRAEAREIERTLRGRHGDDGFMELRRDAYTLLRRVAHLTLSVEEAQPLQHRAPAEYQALMRVAQALSDDRAAGRPLTVTEDAARNAARYFGLPLPTGVVGGVREPDGGWFEESVAGRGQGTSQVPTLDMTLDDIDPNVDLGIEDMAVELGAYVGDGFAVPLVEPSENSTSLVMTLDDVISDVDLGTDADSSDADNTDADNTGMDNTDAIGMDNTDVENNDTGNTHADSTDDERPTESMDLDGTSRASTPEWFSDVESMVTTERSPSPVDGEVERAVPGWGMATFILGLFRQDEQPAQPFRKGTAYMADYAVRRAASLFVGGQELTTRHLTAEARDLWSVTASRKRQTLAYLQATGLSALLPDTPREDQRYVAYMTPAYQEAHKAKARGEVPRPVDIAGAVVGHPSEQAEVAVLVDVWLRVWGLIPEETPEPDGVLLRLKTRVRALAEADRGAGRTFDPVDFVRRHMNEAHPTADQIALVRELVRASAPDRLLPGSSQEHERSADTSSLPDTSAEEALRTRTGADVWSAPGTLHPWAVEPLRGRTLEVAREQLTQYNGVDVDLVAQKVFSPGDHAVPGRMYVRRWVEQESLLVLRPEIGAAAHAITSAGLDPVAEIHEITREVFPGRSDTSTSLLEWQVVGYLEASGHFGPDTLSDDTSHHLMQLAIAAVRSVQRSGLSLTLSDIAQQILGADAGDESAEYRITGWNDASEYLDGLPDIPSPYATFVQRLGELAARLRDDQGVDVAKVAAYHFGRGATPLMRAAVASVLDGSGIKDLYDSTADGSRSDVVPLFPPPGWTAAKAMARVALASLPPNYTAPQPPRTGTPLTPAQRDEFIVWTAFTKATKGESVSVPELAALAYADQNGAGRDATDFQKGVVRGTLEAVGLGSMIRGSADPEGLRHLPKAHREARTRLRNGEAYVPRSITDTLTTADDDELSPRVRGWLQVVGLFGGPPLPGGLVHHFKERVRALAAAAMHPGRPFDADGFIRNLLGGGVTYEAAVIGEFLSVDPQRAHALGLARRSAREGTPHDVRAYARQVYATQQPSDEQVRQIGDWLIEEGLIQDGGATRPAPSESSSDGTAVIEGSGLLPRTGAFRRYDGETDPEEIDSQVDQTQFLEGAVEAFTRLLRNPGEAIGNGEGRGESKGKAKDTGERTREDALYAVDSTTRPSSPGEGPRRSPGAVGTSSADGGGDRSSEWTPLEGLAFGRNGMPYAVEAIAATMPQDSRPWTAERVHDTLLDLSASYWGAYRSAVELYVRAREEGRLSAAIFADLANKNNLHPLTGIWWFQHLTATQLVGSGQLKREELRIRYAVQVSLYPVPPVTAQQISSTDPRDLSPSLEELEAGLPQALASYAAGLVTGPVPGTVQGLEQVARGLRFPVHVQDRAGYLHRILLQHDHSYAQQFIAFFDQFTAPGTHPHTRRRLRNRMVDSGGLHEGTVDVWARHSDEVAYLRKRLWGIEGERRNALRLQASGYLHQAIGALSRPDVSHPLLLEEYLLRVEVKLQFDGPDAAQREASRIRQELNLRPSPVRASGGAPVDSGEEDGGEDATAWQRYLEELGTVGQDPQSSPSSTQDARDVSSERHWVREVLKVMSTPAGLLDMEVRDIEPFHDVLRRHSAGYRSDFEAFEREYEDALALGNDPEVAIAFEAEVRRLSQVQVDLWRSLMPGRDEQPLSSPDDEVESADIESADEPMVDEPAGTEPVVDEPMVDVEEEQQTSAWERYLAELDDAGQGDAAERSRRALRGLADGSVRLEDVHVLLWAGSVGYHDDFNSFEAEYRNALALGNDPEVAIAFEAEVRRLSQVQVDLWRSLMPGTDEQPLSSPDDEVESADIESADEPMVDEPAGTEPVVDEPMVDVEEEQQTSAWERYLAELDEAAGGSAVAQSRRALEALANGSVRLADVHRQLLAGSAGYRRDLAAFKKEYERNRDQTPDELALTLEIAAYELGIDPAQRSHWTSLLQARTPRTQSRSQRRDGNNSARMAGPSRPAGGNGKEREKGKEPENETDVTLDDWKTYLQRHPEVSRTRLQKSKQERFETASAALGHPQVYAEYVGALDALALRIGPDWTTSEKAKALYARWLDILARTPAGLVRTAEELGEMLNPADPLDTEAVEALLAEKGYTFGPRTHAPGETVDGVQQQTMEQALTEVGAVRTDQGALTSTAKFVMWQWIVHWLGPGVTSGSHPDHDGRVSLARRLFNDPDRQHALLADWFGIELPESSPPPGPVLQSLHRLADEFTYDLEGEFELPDAPDETLLLMALKGASVDISVDQTQHAAELAYQWGVPKGRALALGKRLAAGLHVDLGAADLLGEHPMTPKQFAHILQLRGTVGKDALGWAATAKLVWPGLLSRSREQIIRGVWAMAKWESGVFKHLADAVVEAALQLLRDGREADPGRIAKQIWRNQGALPFQTVLVGVILTERRADIRSVTHVQPPVAPPTAIDLTAEDDATASGAAPQAPQSPLVPPESSLEGAVVHEGSGLQPRTGVIRRFGGDDDPEEVDSRLDQREFLDDAVETFTRLLRNPGEPIHNDKGQSQGKDKGKRKREDSPKTVDMTTRPTPPRKKEVPPSRSVVVGTSSADGASQSPDPMRLESKAFGLLGMPFALEALAGNMPEDGRPWTTGRVHDTLLDVSARYRAAYRSAVALYVRSREEDRLDAAIFGDLANKNNLHPHTGTWWFQHLAATELVPSGQLTREELRIRYAVQVSLYPFPPLTAQQIESTDPRSLRPSLEDLEAGLLPALARHAKELLDGTGGRGGQGLERIVQGLRFPVPVSDRAGYLHRLLLQHDQTYGRQFGEFFRHLDVPDLDDAMVRRMKESAVRVWNLKKDTADVWARHAVELITWRGYLRGIAPKQREALTKQASGYLHRAIGAPSPSDVSHPLLWEERLLRVELRLQYEGTESAEREAFTIMRELQLRPSTVRGPGGALFEDGSSSWDEDGDWFAGSSGTSGGVTTTDRTDVEEEGGDQRGGEYSTVWHRYLAEFDTGLQDAQNSQDDAPARREAREALRVLSTQVEFLGGLHAFDVALVHDLLFQHSADYRADFEAFRAVYEDAGRGGQDVAQVRGTVRAALSLDDAQVDHWQSLMPPVVPGTTGAQPATAAGTVQKDGVQGADQAVTRPSAKRFLSPDETVEGPSRTKSLRVDPSDDMD